VTAKESAVPRPDVPTRRVLGIDLHATTEDETVELCDEAIRRREPLRIGMVNAAKFVLMRDQPLLRDSVTGSDLVCADGMSVVWASRILGQPLPARVNGTNLFEKLLALADRRGYRVFLLGARPEILAELCRRVQARHPGLEIVGSQDGYFSDEQAPEVARRIREARPDMLFVGITSPKKEIFMARFDAEIEVPVVHGVGGSFDVLAGLVPRAPASWQNAGLEWLYRLLQEPGRLWRRYLVTNSTFAWWVFTAWLQRALRRRPA